MSLASVGQVAVGQVAVGQVSVGQVARTSDQVARTVTDTRTATSSRGLLHISTDTVATLKQDKINIKKAIMIFTLGNKKKYSQPGMFYGIVDF